MNIRRICRLMIVFVIAVGMMGASASSASAATAKTPWKVTGVASTYATSQVITIKWNASKYSKKYEVQYRVAKTGVKWKSLVTTKKTATFKKLKQNTSYQFKVRGINGTKKGKFSNVLTQKTYLFPASVKTIYAIKRSKNEIVIKWPASKNATMYEVTERRLNSSYIYSGNSDYDQVSPDKFVVKPEYTSRTTNRPNTWYEFRVRAVNSKVGKNPKRLVSAWSEPFYACTTTGNRLITGQVDEESGVFLKYNMTGVFTIGVDDPLIPEGIYEMEDPTEPWYQNDVMYVEGIAFPVDFEDDSESLVNGQTFNIGDLLDGDEIQEITVGPSVSDDGSFSGFEVAFKLGDHYWRAYNW